MRRGGRFRRRSILTRILFFCAGIAIASCIEYGVPIEIKYWDTGRSPLSHMVDVTNGFGLKVLAEHNFLNDNNIAFSPYGLMGIMMALYEGVDGESSYQIQRAMQLPWNRKVMRIGFRDIHRTLKTYFVPEEGFLAGLALNNENVTFIENYKKVLRFYGFDLESEQTPTTSPDLINSTSTSAAPSDSLESKFPTTVMTTLNVENVSTPAKEESSTNPSVTTNVNKQTQESTATPLSTTTPMNEASSTIESTTTLNNLLESTTTITEVPTEASTASSTVLVTSTTSEPLSTTVTTLNTDVEIITDITTEQTSVATSSMTTEPSTILTENTITTMTQDSEVTTIMTNSAATTGTTESIMTSTMTTQTSTESALTTETITPTTENPTTSTESLMLTTENSTNNVESLTNQTTVVVNESSLETLERRKKSIVDFIFTNPPYIEDYMLFRSYDIGPDLSNGGFEFFVNGLKNIQVSYMNYDTMLEHAYLPHLEASALKLPLDSDRYYLLVVLPNRRRAGELEKLLTRMARESDLSDVYAALRPRRVRALVPSFMVKGHVILTTDLQKIGIRDVFEPRQNDFTPMTCQGGVYVRSIEQAVSVAIRKYQPDDTKISRYVTNRRRVYFSATYPFLYFVMDSNIHVALMAGKMVDPLNTRIL